MGLIAAIKRWLNMIFKNKAEQAFDVQSVISPQMDAYILKCANIYKGAPEWVDPEDNIKTINFAKTISSETARLTTLGIKVTIDGSTRANYLQKAVNSFYFRLRDWVEYGVAYGTVVLKPNGTSLDAFTPINFIPTEIDDNKRIIGGVFIDTYDDNKKHYTRFEYHRFIKAEEDGRDIYPYVISNRAYVSTNPESLGEPIALTQTKWADLMPDSPSILKANGDKLDGPMFGVFKTPQANNIDIESPEGLPIYSDAIEELKDLDIAYSRNSVEIDDSQKIIFLDVDAMFPSGSKVDISPEGVELRKRSLKLPHYVKNVRGDGKEIFYQEVNPQLNTSDRIAGINHILSIIGFKCGYSNGYFVFDEKTGMVTATQVEADDRRTLQLIKDCRDKLEDALNGAIYALNLYADLYGLAPAGEYKITYDFGDITYNREEDRARWFKYVQQGYVPAWMYFVKFEGMSEEEAKLTVQEAKEANAEPDLFSRFEGA